MIDLQQGDYIYKGTILKQNRDTEAMLVFLADIGKTWIFVQGRGHNRFLGATEPINWGEFCLYKNSHGLFARSINIKNDFLHLRRDAKSLYLATKIYTLLCDKLPLEIENNSLLQSLYDTLTLIDEGANGEATFFRFLAKFLASYGVMPSFNVCGNCGSVINDSAFLSNRGVFCDKCGTSDSLHLGENDLREAKAALSLPHEEFLLWCRAEKQTSKFKFFSNILETYFDKLK